MKNKSEVLDKLNTYKNINLHYKNIYNEKKNAYIKNKEHNDILDIREERKKLSDDKIFLLNEKYDKQVKLVRLFPMKLLLYINFKICLKFNLFVSFFIIYKYRNTVNKKVIFTSSMAGENYWKKLSIKLLQSLFLLIMAIIIIFPFYWMIVTSFRTTNDLDPTKPISFWPTNWSLEGYKALFEYIDSNKLMYSINVEKFFLNSILVSVLSTFLQLTVSIIAGFGLANYRTKTRGIILIFLLSTMMIPGEALLLGQYIFMINLDLKNNILALVLPFIANVFTIYLMSQAFERIGKSIKNASKVDGLSTFKYFWKVAIPSIKSVIFTSFIISLISSWNAVLWPSMILKTSSGWATVPMMLWGLMSATGGAGGDTGLEELARDPQNLKLAGATLSIIPMLIIFLFTNRLIINGITKGRGEKG